MPISKERLKLYPGGSLRSPEWLAIRGQILARAESRCEFCSAPDRKLIARGCADAAGTYMLEDGAVHCALTGKFFGYGRGSEYSVDRFVRVVLTIMHLDHDPGNNDPANLKAGCQRCHNTYDAQFRRGNAAKTRRAKSPQIDIEEFLSTQMI